MEIKEILNKLVGADSIIDVLIAISSFDKLSDRDKLLVIENITVPSSILSIVAELQDKFEHADEICRKAVNKATDAVIKTRVRRNKGD
ncbi:MAG: hypothetical protein FWF56_03615 [Firmicutes bacterium]|nr:hypothetical protein [Bacillota bacterium]